MTQQQLAHQAETTPATLCRLEQSLDTAKLATLRRIARALRVSIRELAPEVFDR